MKKKGIGLLLAGVVFVGIGIALRSLYIISEVAFSAFLTAGVVAIVITSLKYRKAGETVQDERTRRIAQQSLALSWFFTYVLLSLLVWIHILKIIPLNVLGVLAVIMLFMSISGFVIRIVYSRRGDVE
jgi:hypothetical protein